TRVTTRSHLCGRARQPDQSHHRRSIFAQPPVGGRYTKAPFLRAGSEPELEGIFASLAQLRVGALIISPDIFFNERDEQIAALTLGTRCPLFTSIVRLPRPEACSATAATRPSITVLSAHIRGEFSRARSRLICRCNRLPRSS